MTEQLRIITNNVPRDVVDAWELTPAEREQFDYLNWEAIEQGNDFASFFRFKGEVYDLGEFERSNVPGWDGQQSGLLVRWVDDFERVIVARYLA